MLTIYRRHQKRCQHRREGRRYRRCSCAIWVHGHLNGEDIHKSLNARDWQKAQGIVREWEVEGKQPVAAKIVTVEHASEEFLRDAVSRNLREPTIYKYRLLFRRMKSFADEQGFQSIRQFDLPAARAFRATWPNRNIAARKKLEALRAFFRFCWESGWIENNPASKLKPPKTFAPPTMPFTRAEVARVLAACDQYGLGYGNAGKASAWRLKTLLQLLRFSGLRIRDAVTLRRDHVVDGKLLLYTAKTGTPVYCPLPDFLAEALTTLPGREYFFWSGVGKPKSCVGDWQRSLRKLFLLASVPGGHAHRFRHTFATDLLLAGVPLDRVATLLGHTNSKVTERHYAPWIRARQEQLEADVKRVWDQSLSPCDSPSRVARIN